MVMQILPTKLLIALTLISACPASADNPIDLPKILQSIAQVESGCNDKAHNVKEDAAGRYQIRPIYLRDVNRILGHNHYKPDDRYNAIKSTEIVLIYWQHYAKLYTLDELAALHNGGYPVKMDCTKKYRDRVRAIYKSL